jgi:hypothetical protein
MPYITKEERKKLDPIIDQLFELCQGLRGRINYCCTKLVHLWVLQRMKAIKSFTKKYRIVNDAYGILCCATSEFYSAVILPYEKLKSKLNGPVSQLDAFPDGKILKEYKCRACGYEFNNQEADCCCPECKSSNWIVNDHE